MIVICDFCNKPRHSDHVFFYFYTIECVECQKKRFTFLWLLDELSKNRLGEI